jgi:hypothetical protein
VTVNSMARVHRQKAQYLCGRCGRVFDTVVKLHDHQRNCKQPASFRPEGQAKHEESNEVELIVATSL